MEVVTAVKLKKIQRRNPRQTDITKWYLVQKKTGTIGIGDISRDIAERSSLSEGDVQSVLRNLVKTMPLFLKLGQTIRLEGLGSFYVSVKSEGVETIDELKTHHVKGSKLIFRPSPELKRNLDNISFEIVL